MDEPTAKKVQLHFESDSSVPPLFADQIIVNTINQMTIISFYYALPVVMPGGSGVPDEIEASLVARVVVPERQWASLLDGIVKNRAAMADSEKGAEDVCASDPQ